MGIKIRPFYYGHAAGRKYNVGDIVVLDERKKSSDDTDAIERTMWVCVQGHVSSSDSLEKNCWVLNRERELEVNSNDNIL